MTNLSQMQPGQKAKVLAVDGEPSLTQRLYEFGLLEGETIEVLALAPLGDPIEIRLGNTRLTLRRHEAAAITVQPIGS